MSSIENQSASPPPLAEASEVYDDNHGQSATAGSSSKFTTTLSSPRKGMIAPPTNRKSIEEHEVVQTITTDPNFPDLHLRAAPSFAFTQGMLQDIVDIEKAGNSEHKMYNPAASLLTAISRVLYDTLSKELKDAHRERHRIRPGNSEHLTFIKHHSSPPTHFPSHALCPVGDSPDLLGVYDVELFESSKDAQGVYKGVPHHRIEAIVEAKSERKGGGCRQAATYAYRHHQARPDRPGSILLVIKPKWYQVLYSDPTGIVASVQTPWSNQDLLAAYVYSHYSPPDGHFLWDDSIRWVEPGPACGFPTWEVEFDGATYTNGQFVFVGDPWGRRTNILDVVDEHGSHVILKDSYRHRGRRFKEEEILEHIHADGDLLGVVRLKSHATVVDAHGSVLQFTLQGEEALRTRERFGLLDTGSRLLKAKSVDDLLKAVFDALEVHRTQLVQRSVLHRDMSIYNLLMYPEWGSSDGRQVMQNLSPSIKDVLEGETRPVEERFPDCLVIDYDNSARLDLPAPKAEELTQRTGTPMYIARGVCAGVVLTSPAYLSGPAMPELSGTARELYIRAYGEERYQRYCDRNGTRHGALPALADVYAEYTPPTELPTFYHRPEHDVESVYWSMVSALLQVHPQDYTSEREELEALFEAWEIFDAHEIPKATKWHRDDPRQHFLTQSSFQWLQLLPANMRNVALLLHKISLHVNPEYALWKDGLEPDHLHEAVQRLILQYLVDHATDPIPLDPARTRPTKEKKTTKTRLSAQMKATGSAGGSTSRAGATKRGSQTHGSRGSTKRKDMDDSVELAGPSAGSRSRNTAAGQPVIVEPKRKQAGRRSKRAKSGSGTPLSIEENDEEYNR